MSLAEKFADHFTNSIRSRGEAYCRQGRVYIKQVSDSRLDAKVRGSESYQVILELRQKELQASCTCPYFEQDFCKHIWATMLEADADGRFSDATDKAESFEFADLDDDEGYDDEYSYDEDADDDDFYGVRRAAPPPGKTPAAAGWETLLDRLKAHHKQQEKRNQTVWPNEREAFFLVDVAATLQAQGLIIETWYRDRKQNGDWGKLQRLNVSKELFAQLPDASEREIFSRLLGASTDLYDDSSYAGNRFRLYHPAQQMILRVMCETGRCYVKMQRQLYSQAAPELEPHPLVWDDRVWEFTLKVRRDGTNGDYVATGVLQGGGQQSRLSDPVLMVAGGLVCWSDRAAVLDDNDAFSWISLLRKEGDLSIPAGQRDAFFEKLIVLPAIPRLDLPDELAYEERREEATPVVKFSALPGRYNDKLATELTFAYGDWICQAEQNERGVFDTRRRCLTLRDTAFEQRAMKRLKQLGCRSSYHYFQRRDGLELDKKNLPRAVKTLLKENWRVEAEGKLYRQAGRFNVQVSSGLDWFEVSGEMQFGDAVASLPALLEALRRGETTVLLDDGTFGMVPEEWLKKYGVLAELGETEGARMRFRKSQTGLLDALLAAQPEVSFDEGFARARAELASFAGIHEAEEPAGFVGKLRGYQREGLGWLHFLRKFGFGGCLADHMGLGKTPTTLALLVSRREVREAGEGKRKPARKATPNDADGAPPGLAPSLVVVPKSLVFNWKQEAARFSPHLRVLDHTGNSRKKVTNHFANYDLIITTYGTLRKDARQFKDFQFDYIILDESQAIKNATTESAKAVRLLRGDYKLALSGTPIENHLGELWSLFDFLNPGLLGSASVFKLTGAGGRTIDVETRDLLARGLRPFILRRTKEQVAKDLPEKLEQTIYCELDKEQRKLYNELRDYYRAAILGLVEKFGIKRSKIQVLEALLRLRQAACHPGLIDKKRVSEASAKLDLLMTQLEDLHEEGHKTLVFSQFTSFLAIARNRLDKAAVPYEYLDGHTRDRQGRVERFQRDPDCKLFLISLKAGGLGLNLTAAEYVFLLDPWWNPAVEAQAIDRAHRIGQKRKVFAYRLIARETVEEKVLELQNHKRDLAEAIINADNSLIRNLNREDLELLLS